MTPIQTFFVSASVLSSSTFESKITMTVPKTLYKVGDYVDVSITMTSDPVLTLKISPQMCRAASAASGGTTYDLVSSRYVVRLRFVKYSEDLNDFRIGLSFGIIPLQFYYSNRFLYLIVVTCLV